MTLISAVRIGLQRNPNFGGGTRDKAIRHDSDNRIGLAVQRHAAIEDGGIASEMRVPKLFGDERRLGTARSVFRDREGAAQQGACAKNLEVARGDVNALHLLRTVAS